jgi:hypothetical protein
MATASALITAQRFRAAGSSVIAGYCDAAADTLAVDGDIDIAVNSRRGIPGRAASAPTDQEMISK